MAEPLRLFDPCDHLSVGWKEQLPSTYQTGTPEGGTQVVCYRCYAVLSTQAAPVRAIRRESPNNCEGCKDMDGYTLYRTSHLVDEQLVTQWLCYKCRKKALPPKQQRPKPAYWVRAIAIWAMRQDGLTFKEIGKHFGLNHESMRRAFEANMADYTRVMQHKSTQEAAKQRTENKLASNRVLNIDDHEFMRAIGFKE